jgi:rhodanese-related sulfurtransferase
MGYTNVKSIAGGLQAWINADFPTLRTSQPMED